MIKRLRVKNFKALRDIEIELTPVHVLIGPNDSGKTSILDVFAALCRSADHRLNEAFLGSWKSKELVWAGDPQIPVTIEVDIDGSEITSYGITVVFGARDRKAVIKSEFFKGQGPTIELGEVKVANRTWVEHQLMHPHPLKDLHKVFFH